MMRRLTALFVVALAVAGVATARAELPPIISRDLLFGNPERIEPKVSPDGRRLAWIAPDKSNVLQVWVKTIGQEDGRAVTADKRRGIRRYVWAYDDRTIIYQQDSDGDENFHLFGVDLTSGNIRDLTPFQGVRAELADVNPRFPSSVLCTLNLRDRKLMDVYKIDLRTGAIALDTQNPGDVGGWATDDNQIVRGASVTLPDGGTELRVRSALKGKWTSLLKVSQDEDLDLLDFSKDGRSVFLLTSVGTNAARVVERSLSSGSQRDLARDDGLDADEVTIHPTRHVVQAVGFVRGRREWTVVDPSVKDDFAGIGKLSDGDFRIVNRDRADKTWLIAFSRDRGAIRYYAWDRATRKGTFLFVHRSKLEGLELAEMRPTVIKSRDGMDLQSYLTLPVGVPGKNLPLVLLVHGGPWARDYWGYSSQVQWLANRGYAVLQVNYRGSTGFGKSFEHAADKQWGRAMQNDLSDAVKWAVGEGIADAKRVAIVGWSYGGYAALAGATFTPDLFRCAIDGVGVANLLTWIKAIPPYWQPYMGLLKKRVGDIDDPKDHDLMTKVSPLFSADRIKIPMLIGQGANDPRVPQRESEQIVAAIEKNHGHVTYVLYSDEGHGFERPENSLDFFARAEVFLADILGGRLEKMAADRIPGSTAVVRYVGAKPATAQR
jgi:dipeptidyl aminopeptidase/acylaminoacyl peptidase